MKIPTTILASILILTLAGSPSAQPAGPPGTNPFQAHIKTYTPQVKPPAGSPAFLKGWKEAEGLYQTRIWVTRGNPQANGLLIDQIKQQLTDSTRWYEAASAQQPVDLEKVQRFKGQIAYFETALDFVQNMTAGGQAASAAAPPPTNPPPKGDEPWVESEGHRVEYADLQKKKANHEDSISSGNRTVTRSEMEQRRQAEDEIWERYRRGEITAQEHQKLLNSLP